MTTAATPARPLCRHCSSRFVNRPLGLCWSCYYTDGVRELYPSTSNKAPKGGDFFGGHALAQPTSELPATKAKIEAMAERVRQRLAVFHPADGRRGLA